MDLRITEIFLSIQGESTHAGRPCSFVRLTGCPMRCVWCDSEYTFTGGEKIAFDDIFAKLEQFGCKLAKGDEAEAIDPERVRQMQNAELEGSQKLWRPLVVAAILALIVETGLAGRRARGRGEAVAS